MSVAGPPRDANSAAVGGSEAAKPQACGEHTCVAGPSRDANSAAVGGSEAAKLQAWGGH